MKNVKTILIVTLLFLSLTLVAQEEHKGQERFSFSSINSVGLIVGDDESALAVQTVNGVAYKNWFAGVGAGLDYYYWRSLPLFIALRKNLASKKWPLFAYGDVGVNVPWIKDSYKESLWYRSDFKTGLYYDVGAGLAFPLQKGEINISAGFSTKQLREYQTFPYIWGPPGKPDRVDRLDYKFSRLLVKAGYRF